MKPVCAQNGAVVRQLNTALLEAYAERQVSAQSMAEEALQRGAPGGCPWMPLFGWAE
jgi:hypothetical protein